MIVCCLQVTRDRGPRRRFFCPDGATGAMTHRGAQFLSCSPRAASFSMDRSHEHQVWEKFLNTLDVGACVCSASGFIGSGTGEADNIRKVAAVTLPDQVQTSNHLDNP